MAGRDFRESAFPKGTDRARATCPQFVEDEKLPLAEKMKEKVERPTFGRDVYRPNDLRGTNSAVMSGANECLSGACKSSFDVLLVAKQLQ